MQAACHFFGWFQRLDRLFVTMFDQLKGRRAFCCWLSKILCCFRNFAGRRSSQDLQVGLARFAVGSQYVRGLLICLGKIDWAFHRYRLVLFGLVSCCDEQCSDWGYDETVLRTHARPQHQTVRSPSLLTLWRMRLASAKCRRFEKCRWIPFCPGIFSYSGFKFSDELL